MNNSPTEGEQQTTGLENQPTGEEQVQQTSAEQNQETNSGANTQESVSDDTAQNQQTQTEEKGGQSQTDDGLAKFAKSQGVDDVSTLSEDALRFLKIAHDNQKAFREKGSSQSITDSTKPQADADTSARLAHLEYERETDKFFQDKDRSLEVKMIQVLNEKREKYGDAYAFQLSRDLDSLYALAGGSTQAPVDAEAIRREERESINRQMSAGAPDAHATVGGDAPETKVNEAWIQNEYDPRNPEHRKLVDAYYGRS